MKPAQTVEALDYVPRDLALAYTSGGKTFYLSPIKDITGGALVRPPSVIGERLRSTQRYKAWHARQIDEGKSTYAPLFPWDEELIAEPDIAGAFRSSVRKSEGAATLFDAMPHQAVKYMYLRGRELEAKVKSKARPGGTTPNYNVVFMESPFLDPNGDIQLARMNCTCGDFAYSTEKGSPDFLVRCLHQAALTQEFWARTEYPETNRKVTVKPGSKTGPIFMPFTFTENYRPTRGGGFKPQNPHLAALEYDALVAYYILKGAGNEHFGIDRKLYGLSEIYSPTTLNAIRERMIKRAVIGQRPMRRGKAPRGLVKAERHVFRQMARVLAEAGYRPVGRCLELGDNVAKRFENGDNAVSIVTGSVPMHYTVRTGVNSGRVRPTGSYRGATDPFFLFGNGDIWGYDDYSMSDTSFQVQLPSAMRIPESKRSIPIAVPDVLKNRWRQAIRKSNPGNSERKLKYARLKY